MTLTLTKTGITANESKLERAKNTTFQYRSRELQKEILRNSTTKKIDQKKHITTTITVIPKLQFAERKR